MGAEPRFTQFRQISIACILCRLCGHEQGLIFVCQVVQINCAVSSQRAIDLIHLTRNIHKPALPRTCFQNCEKLLKGLSGSGYSHRLCSIEPGQC